MPLAAMRSGDGVRCHHHCRALSTPFRLTSCLLGFLSGRHGQPRRSRNLQPLSEAGGTRLSESASHGLLLRLENTEVRTNFQQLKQHFHMAALQHYVATCLQHHATTGLRLCHG